MSAVAKQKKLKHNVLLEHLHSKKERESYSIYTIQAELFLNLIHDDCRNSYISIFTKQHNQKYNYCFKKEDLDKVLYKFLDLEDIYMSINSFYVTSRKAKYLRQLNTFFIDIDYYSIAKYKNYTNEQLIAEMRKDGMFDDLEPSFFVSSGRGFYIFYLIENVPRQAQKKWVKTQNEFVKKFEKYGGDHNAKDVSRVLRIPGTVNSKNGRRGYIIFNNESQLYEDNKIEDIRRYTLKDVSNIVLKDFKHTKKEWLELKKQHKKEKKKYVKKEKNKVVGRLLTLKNLNYNRAEDIKKLINKRKNTGKNKHQMLYMYALFRYYADYNIENITEDLNKLNSILIEPINDIDNVLNSAKDAYSRYLDMLKKYNDEKEDKKKNLVLYLRENNCIIYSNTGIINRLKITENEMNELQLSTIINLNIKKLRKSNYNKKYYADKLKKEGKTTKQEQLQEIRQKIKALRYQGLKNKEIMQMLSITSTTTFKRHISYLKENGLIE